MEFEEGDILIIRFGWTEGYLTLNEAGRKAWGARKVVKLIGVETSKAVAEWLWEKNFSAVAADTVAFERLPFDPAGEPGGLEKLSLHEVLLGGWGMPIGVYNAHAHEAPVVLICIQERCGTWSA